jgi:beta-lactamase class D
MTTNLPILMKYNKVIKILKPQHKVHNQKMFKYLNQINYINNTIKKILENIH